MISWSLQVEFLQQHYHVLVLDNRGTGQSSLPPFRYTTTMMAHDIYEVMTHLKWNTSAYHIVGASMGGMISQELALIAPEKVQSLCLFSTHAGWGNGLTCLPPFQMTVVQIKNMFISDLHTRLHNAMTILYGNKILQDEKRYTELFEKAVEKNLIYGNSPFSTFIAQVLAIFTHSVPASRMEALKMYQVPTLILTGGSDLMVHPENSIKLGIMLDVNPIVHEEHGHHMLWEDAHLINTSIHDHIQKQVLKSTNK